MSDENTQPNAVPEVPPVVAIPEEKYYCANCREHLTASGVTKAPLDYSVQQDGTYAPSYMRFSAFCKKCQKVLGIFDPQAAAKLSKMSSK